MDNFGQPMQTTLRTENERPLISHKEGKLHAHSQLAILTILSQVHRKLRQQAR